MASCCIGCVCREYILKESVEYVLEYLADANFDPEFYKKYEPEIIAKFNRENNTSIQLKKKSWKRIFSKV